MSTLILSCFIPTGSAGYREDVRQILVLFCFSDRPLRVRVALHGHAVTLGRPAFCDTMRLMRIEGLLDICQGLIEVLWGKYGRPKDASVVRIAHYSVREYLMSDHIQRQKAAVFALRPGLSTTGLLVIGDSRLTKKCSLCFKSLAFRVLGWFVRCGKEVH